ncbi:MAG: hypothetical protein GY856_06785 [bacterium]|nr:hypothetical protein [bacterium]
MQNFQRTPNADARKQIEREITRLATTIEKFRIDAQRFFAGDLMAPPEELRDRIVAELRRLQASKLAGVAENFRLNTLEAQFNSQVELFGRRLRARETGEGVKKAEPAVQHDPEKGVVVGPQARAGAVEALYKGLYLRTGTRNPQMDLERFRTYLGRQAETIRAKTGCAEIQFRIAEEGGKLKIKAKPVRSKA